MKKIDLKKQFKGFYAAKKKPVTVKVPEFNYISIDGKGDPNGSKSFQAAVSALYTADAWVYKRTGIQDQRQTQGNISQ